MLITLAKIAVLPPGVIVILALIGMAVYRRRPRLGLVTIFTAVFTLWAVSMPWTAAIMARSLERYPPFKLSDLESFDAEAIIVLGGGAYRHAPEFNRFNDVSRLTLERLRYAARLHRATGLDLAVTGGIPAGLETPEGLLMRTVLDADFGVDVRWAEIASKNTTENARLSSKLFPFKVVVLVTHAVHMPRAVRAFEDAGFTVIPAPLGYISRRDWSLSFIDFLPEMKALNATRYVIYEYFGAVWYHWHFSA